MSRESLALHREAMTRLRAGLPGHPDGPVPGLIGGEWRAHGTLLDTVDPTTGEVLVQVVAADEGDVDTAAKAAVLAGARWWATDGQDRARAMRAVADLVRSRAPLLGLADTLDVGRPIRDTVTRDVERAARLFEFWAGATDRLRGSAVPVQSGFSNVVLREPYGVVGAITPWNYPLTNAATKLAPALATGNAVLLKPAEESPLSALMLAQCIIDAGLPPGLVSVLNGSGEVTGSAIVEHPLVGKITFTGSTSVGRMIGGRCGDLLKSVSLELGGKSPMLVFPDADLDVAARAATFTAFLNTGQTCTAGTRLVVHSSIAADFLDRVTALAAELRPGDPLEESTLLGPLVSRHQRDVVRGYIDAGIRDGAQLVGTPTGTPEGGWFQAPVVFTDVDPRMSIATDEIFGPVLSVFTFTDEQEAVALANDTPYGLAASVWTSDLERSARLTAVLEAGLVWVNCVHALHPGSPYGGYKSSGVGLEMGDEAIHQLMKVKSVWTATSKWRSPWD
jgi:acyl-CoA reductase-like NAD-dependent aldehyde dehydrogenase